MGFKPLGIISTVVIPVMDEEKVNERALRELISYLIFKGVNGLFPMGSRKKNYELTDDKFKAVLEIVKDETNGRIPVYVGTNHTSIKDIVRLAQKSEEIGVDAMVVSNTNNISINQDELFKHFETIAYSTKLPIILHSNNPKTGIGITPEIASQLAGIRNVIGMIDSTGDIRNLEEYLKLTHKKDFDILIGTDTLIYAALCQGAIGAITSCSNITTKAASDIYEKYILGDMAGALEAQLRLSSFYGLSRESIIKKEGKVKSMSKVIKLA